METGTEGVVAAPFVTTFGAGAEPFDTEPFDTEPFAVETAGAVTGGVDPSPVDTTFVPFPLAMMLR